MNVYATVEDAVGRLFITDTSQDALLLVLLEAASRAVDQHCQRAFFVESATRYFDTGPKSNLLVVDDLLVLTSLNTDSELDGTFDGETWTEGDTNDFILWPYNKWPKMRILTVPAGDFSFAKNVQRYVKIVGFFGFGNGKSATPYEASGVTVTVADAVLTTLTVSVEGTIQAGHTVLAGTEQMFVTAATSDGSKAITVERGVNGTTAADQSTAAASIYRYPPEVNQATLITLADFYKTMADPGLASERIGDYSYQRLSNTGKLIISQSTDRLLGQFRILGA